MIENILNIPVEQLNVVISGIAIIFIIAIAYIIYNITYEILYSIIAVMLLCFANIFLAINNNIIYKLNFIDFMCLYGVFPIWVSILIVIIIVCTLLYELITSKRNEQQKEK